MRAMQMNRQGGPEVLMAVELPDPVPQPGQILIRVQAAAVNYSDVMRRAGLMYPFPTPLPFVPGSEVAGTVAALGDGVDGPPVGTPVFALTGEDGSGGYAEFALAGARNVIPIPPGMAPERAAGIIVAGVTAAVLLTEAAPPSPGDTVLVPAAAGGVGGFLLQIARLVGAGTVIATAGSEEKRRLTVDLGADHALDPDDPGWPARVRDITGGRGVDLALEMTGGDQLGRSLESLAPFGTLLVYGMASGVPGRLAPEQIDALLYRPAMSQRVVSFNLGLWFGLRPERAAAALRRLLSWVDEGALNVPETRAFPLEHAPEAHRLLAARATTGKLVLVP